MEFGKAKRNALPRYCLDCEVLFACNGECPKNRFILAPGGEPGLNYLCSGFRKYFNHIDPWMRLIAREIRSGRTADNVMRMARSSTSVDST